MLNRLLLTVELKVGVVKVLSLAVEPNAGGLLADAPNAGRLLADAPKLNDAAGGLLTVVLPPPPPKLNDGFVCALLASNLNGAELPCDCWLPPKLVVLKLLLAPKLNANELI